MHMASLQPHVNLWVATSIRGCNEWKYQIVEVHGKYWIRGYHRFLFLVSFCSVLLWMICSFSWRDVIYIITLMITPNKLIPRYRNGYTKPEAWLSECDPVVHRHWYDVSKQILNHGDIFETSGITKYWVARWCQCYFWTQCYNFGCCHWWSLKFRWTYKHVMYRGCQAVKCSCGDFQVSRY